MIIEYTNYMPLVIFFERDFLISNKFQKWNTGIFVTKAIHGKIKKQFEVLISYFLKIQIFKLYVKVEQGSAMQGLKKKQLHPYSAIKILTKCYFLKLYTNIY